MRSLINIVTGLWSFVAGLWVTFINAVRRPVTFQYPERYLVPFEGFRGHPALVVDPETGATTCTGCQACVKACPLGIISMEVAQGEDKKRYPVEWRLEFGRCMVCNLCVESCPFDALEMSPNYELAEYRPEALDYNMERLKMPRGSFDAARLDGTLVKVGLRGGDGQ